MNENDPDAEIEMVDAIGYRRLNCIFAITLPDNTEEERDFLNDTPRFHVLENVTEAKDIQGDGTQTILKFTELGRSFILDITSIKHIVGRVFTRGVRPAGEWAIVDRTQDVANTTFQMEEHGSDDEEDWNN
ncbi:hypothetical protein OPQ81_005079 [Rhizoctonia solani]|nr:hypothetical protein OPQ81_005079 [Rhizoctonia solani]